MASQRSFVAAILAAALAGCSTVSSTTAPLRSPTPPDATETERKADRAGESRIGSSRAVQTGYASWYGRPHHGRRTASGELFDMHDLTAAHPNLPMGTRLLVTNLSNGHSAEVRVNDRGPVVDGRIIDLSYAAARRVGAIGDGVIPVRVRVVTTPSP
jgi:rare lipoprotein A